MVAVAPSSDEAGIRELMAGEGYSLPVLLAQSSVAAEYGVRGVPTLVVLDENGAVFQKLSGPVSLLRLSRILDDVTGG